MLEDVDPPEVSMVRVLIVLAITIPIAIEVVTFGGLIAHYAGGGGSGPAATPTPDGQTAAATQTPADSGGATAGDEILSTTAATERIEGATVTDGDDATTLTLTVTVADPPDGYELRLRTVTTGSGRTAAGNASTTGTLSAGERGSVTGRWQLPPGERPDILMVAVASHPSDGTPTTQTYAVDLSV